MEFLRFLGLRSAAFRLFKHFFRILCGFNLIVGENYNPVFVDKICCADNDLREIMTILRSPNGCPWVIIGVIAAIAAVIASLTTAFILVDKKRKNDEELDRYFDCSIQ